MKASELFPRFSPALIEQIFSFLQDTQKPSLRMAIQTLATQRKLRPVFVERKPRPERFAWLASALGKPVNDGIAANLLQMWLMDSQSAMLCDFLDAMGIEHDEKGGIENLPPSPPAEQVRAAVDALLAKHPPEAAAAYLHCFQSMEIAGWPALGELLESDPRLQLSAAPAKNP